jgi:hypothetical protein
MATCSSCNSSCGDGVLFCPRCGSLPQRSARKSYAGSVVLGAALLLLAVVWKFVAAQMALVDNQPTIVPPPPDDAATLIAKCGQPDSDKLSNSGSPQNATRALVYQKPRVKAVFHHDASESGWRLQAMLDAKTLKPIASEKMTKRLPCSANPK